MKKLFNYNEFLNEGLFDQTSNQFFDSEVYLNTIPELTSEEVKNITQYGYNSARALYSIMTMKSQKKENLMLSFGLNEDRYDEIVDIIKSNIDPIERKEIEDYIPIKYAIGCLLPKMASFFTEDV